MKSMSRSVSGFSLIELLLVLAIIGILSGIAIPSFLGQRRRARQIGDAQSNAKALAMILEARKAENGAYATASKTYTWNADGSFSGSVNIAPAFTPKGNSKMNYVVVVGATGLTYTMTVKDTTLNGASVYTLDQAGNGKNLNY